MNLSCQLVDYLYTICLASACKVRTIKTELGLINLTVVLGRWFWLQTETSFDGIVENHGEINCQR